MTRYIQVIDTFLYNPYNHDDINHVTIWVELKQNVLQRRIRFKREDMKPFCTQMLSGTGIHTTSCYDVKNLERAHTGKTRFSQHKGVAVDNTITFLQVVSDVTT